MSFTEDSEGEHLHRAAEWVRKNVVFDHKRTENVLEVHAATIFPIDDQTVYALLTHPDGEELFRGITACVKRKILHNDGRGNMILEVYNKSDWSVLGLVKGFVISKLLVEQSMEQQVMQFGMVPSSSQMLKDLYGVWKVYNFCQSELNEFMSQREARVAKSFCETKHHHLRHQSLVTFYQRFEFNNEVIPKVLRGPVSRTALRQIRHAFEDLIKEIWNIKANRATLAPYMSSIMKEINSVEESTGDEQSADSVKSILDKKASNSCEGTSQKVSDTISLKVKSQFEAFFEGKIDTDEMNFSAQNAPVSHPLAGSRLHISSSTHLKSVSSLESLASIQFTGDMMDSVDENHSFLRKVKHLVDRYLDFDEDELQVHGNDEMFDGLAWLVVA